jgi:hypothetical protein
MLRVTSKQRRRSSPVTSVAEIAQAMKALLTETATRLGRETGFVRRRSKLDGAGFARAAVLGWGQQPQARLSQLAQMAAAAGVPISPQGLDQRFGEPAASLLRALLAEAMSTLVSAAPVAVPLLRRFTAVAVQDSTVINLPDDLAQVWAGCGDAARHHLAALKVQPRLDLLAGTLDDLLLAAGRTHDRTCARQSAPLAPGSLFLGDLGYFAVPRLRALDAQRVVFVSRLLVSTALFAPTGERLDLAARLRQEAAPALELAVELGVAERLPVRLLAARVRQEVADQRRRQLKEAARKRGRAPSRARLALVGWTILVTNAPPEQLSAAEAFVLARVRWQVELVFKLWKERARVDEWRSGKAWRILCEVYAKLLGVLLQHWLLVASCWHYPDRSPVKAAATVRGHALLIAYALRGAFDLAQVLGLLRETLQACPRLERRKKHPAAFQLLLELPDAALP